MYAELTEIITEVSSATSITKRREGGEKLKSFLKNRKLRIRLADECVTTAIQNASPASLYSSDEPSTTRSQRRHLNSNGCRIVDDPLVFLKQILRHSVQAALQAAEASVASTKTKANVTDITLPHSILISIDADSDVPKKSSNHSANNFYLNEPFTFQSFDRYRDKNVGQTLLSSKEIQLLLAYCLNRLADDYVRTIAEKELLDMLKTLCSRVDYVCYFRLPTDISYIMSELQSFLLNSDSSKEANSSQRSATVQRQRSNLMSTAAKTLNQLVYNCVIKLMLDMQIFVRPCIMLISDWIRDSDVEERVSFSSNSASTNGSGVSNTLDRNVAMELYGVAINMMATYPDACVSIFSDGLIGYNLWKYALKWWDGATLHSHYDILVEYFSAYLLVCEVAGKLQGLLPGDLGDIGSATLDRDKMTHIRNRVLSEKTITLYVTSHYSSSTRSTSSSSQMGSKKSKIESHVCFTPLTKKERRYFALCARLIRCSQRTFLADSELRLALENKVLGTSLVDNQLRPADLLLETLNKKDCDGLSSDISDLSESIIAHSPWFEHIVNVLSRTTTDSCGSFKPPLTAGTLLIISACAEVFPRGECWSSTNRWAQINFCPFSNLLEGQEGVSSYCGVSAPMDLSKIIHLVASVLEQYTAVSNGQQIQSLALVCLLKLTEATAIICRYRDIDTSVDTLGLAWRHVWSIIFRSELRYSTCTSNTSQGSLGELVIMLLTEIVRGHCIDPSIFLVPIRRPISRSINTLDLHLTSSLAASSNLRQKDAQTVAPMAAFFRKHQEDVWSLAAYKSAETWTSASLFELTAVVIQLGGITEGIDAFDCEHSQDVTETLCATIRPSRRLHIALSCIRSLESMCSHVQGIELRRTIPSLSSCLSVLVGGTMESLTTYQLCALRELLIAEDSVTSRDLNHRSCSCTSRQQNLVNVDLLWCDVIQPFSEQFMLETDAIFWRSLHDHDARLTPSWGFHDRKWRSETLTDINASLSDSVSSALALRDFILVKLCRLTVSGNLSHLSLIMKCILQVYLTLNDQPSIPCQTVTLNAVQENIDKLSFLIPSFMSKPDELAFLLLDLIGIFRMMRNIYEVDSSVSLTMLLQSIKKSSLLSASKHCAQCMDAYVKQQDLHSFAFKVLSFENVKDTRLHSNYDYLPSSKGCDGSDIDDDEKSNRKRKHTKIVPAQNESAIFDTANGSSTSEGVVIDSRCAWLCAWLYIILEPSLCALNEVANTLVWPCDMMKKWENCILFDFCEPHNSLVCSSILSCFQGGADSCGKSFLSLFSELILKGRSDASISSSYHMMGFSACSFLFAKYSGSDLNLDYNPFFAVLDPERAQNLLKNDIRLVRRALRDRPFLRASQIRAALNCFRVGDSDFHRAFDIIFAEGFIKPHLTSINALIREVSIESLGLCLSLLPNQEDIVRDGLNLLPLDEIKGAASFRDWVQLKITLGSKSLQQLEMKAWTDSEHSIRYDLFRSIGLMGSMSTDSDILSEVVVKLLNVCMERPSLISLGFVSLQTITHGQGYQNTTALLHYEAISIIGYLLETQTDILSLPIIFCHSALWMSLMRIDVTRIFTESKDGYACQNYSVTSTPEVTISTSTQDGGTTSTFTSNNLSSEDSKVIHSFSIDKFIEENISDLLPMVLLVSKDAERRRRLLSEISKSLLGGETDGEIAQIIRRHLHDIYAFILPIVYATASDKGHDAHTVGSDALSYIGTFLSRDKIDKYCHKNSHLIIEKLLRWSGKRPVIHRSFQVDRKAYLESMEITAAPLKAEKGDASLCNRSLFEMVGTCFTELLLRTIKRLELATQKHEKNEVWISIEVICDHFLLDLKRRITELSNVQSDSNALVASEMGTLLARLLQLASDSRHRSFMSRILTEVKRLVDFSIENSFDAVKEEFRRTWSTLCSALFHLHEVCQGSVLHACIEFCSKMKAHNRHLDTLAVAVLLPTQFDLATAESSGELERLRLALECLEGDGVFRETCETMVQVYDLLESLYCHSSQLLGNEGCFTLDPILDIHMPSYQQDFLLEANPKFSTFLMKDKFLQRFTREKTIQSTDEWGELLTLVRRFHERSFPDYDENSRDNIPMDSCSIAQNRVIINAIARMKTILNEDRDEATEPRKTIMLHTFTNELLHLCHHSIPLSIRHYASRCLGMILDKIEQTSKPIYDLNASQENGETASEDPSVTLCDDPLQRTHVSVFKLVARYVSSNHIDTAILAVHTLSALLATRTGYNCWQAETDYAFKQFIAPFAPIKNMRSRNVPSLEEKEVDNLRRLSGYPIESNNHSLGWCWNPDFWKCPEGEYKTWIRKIVTSIIYCCYGNGKQGICGRVILKGTSDFFQHCINMCFQDDRVATAIFPGLIYDILNSDVTDNSNLSPQKVGTLAETPSCYINIGAPFSLANQLLTACFSTVLSSSASNANSIPTMQTAPSIESDLDAVKLLISVVDMLRRVTESRFLTSTKHQPNPSSNILDKQCTNKAAVVPLEKKLWKGRPYGTVLQLSGIDLAWACIRVGDWSGALYYGELYADNRLGGSNLVFERIADNPSQEFGQYSISGFSTQVEDLISFGFPDYAHNEDAITRALKYHDLYQRALQEYQESDDLDALFQLRSHLRSCLENDLPHYHAEKSIDVCVHGYNLTALLHYDALLQTSKNKQRDADVKGYEIDLIHCMKHVGLSHTLRHYARSVMKCYDLGQDNNEIKDLWAEEAWRLSLWSNFDDSLRVEMPNEMVHPDQSLDDQANTSIPTGFHANIAFIIRSLMEEDVSRFESCLSSCRTSMCDVVMKTGNVLRDKDILQLSLKFAALNDLEDVGLAIFSKSTRNDLLHSYIDNAESFIKLSRTSLHSLNFHELEFLMSIKEIGLRILNKKYGTEHENVSTHLKHHLQNTCVIARQFGLPNVASTTLFRLRQLTERTNVGCQIESVSSALEEARIIREYGDITSAITKTKVLIGLLHRSSNNDSKKELETLLAETYLQCGTWLVEHNIDSAANVLNNYLKPATELLRNVDGQPSTQSRLLSSAHIKLGNFAATLYDRIETKMSSHDFKISTMASADRVSELKNCIKLFDELNTTLSKCKEKDATKNKKDLSSRKSVTGFKEKVSMSVTDLEKKLQDLGLHIRTLQREVELDDRERLLMEESMSSYLVLSVEAFGSALAFGDTSSDYSTSVFRMISLWFQNCYTHHTIHAIIANLFKTIPSFHFVPLTYQIFSRIDKTDGTVPPLSTGSVGMQKMITFQCVLLQLVKKMCIDHPYHCLIQLIALSNGHKIGSGIGGRHADLYLDNVGASKVDACNNLIDNIRRDAPRYVAVLVDSYIALLNSYNELAMLSTADFVEKRGTKNIPFSSIKTHDKNAGPTLDRCLGLPSRRIFDIVPCVLTKPPLLRPSKDYGDGLEDPVGSERILGFQNVFSVTESGIHRPKIVVCNGTKGGHFKQLVKGEDDIRQDAIMVQVFRTINKLLQKNSRPWQSKGLSLHGHKRILSTHDLNMTTYHCIPITPISGILEWVDDTIPFGDYLADKKIGKQYQIGAHSKYYPGEWGNALCRAHLKNSPGSLLREAFDQICLNFSPAFRFFFYERFSHNTERWYEARKKYIKSCAVNSIAGHILGIGDRHAHNILVHQKTGELVHIDFGIVFEQGKLLPIPEIVPFRLTRDIIDGMGPLGTDGQFTAHAVATLSVLRENASSLLTILSAVVSDPLYKWCINPMTARNRQRDETDGGEVNGQRQLLEQTSDVGDSKLEARLTLESKSDAASRTLAKITRKLQGFDDFSFGESQTVEGQVCMLIHAARSPDNLCQMYFGWAPWL